MELTTPINTAPTTDPITAPAIVPAEVEELEDDDAVEVAPARIVDPFESIEKLLMASVRELKS